ncbi:MAG: peptidylprolyl isomerase [Burkholderiales bacterium PBB4]|nr:MAG: peptidylprolyl isomerase [Burkholderiales bacterium PBB4]
MFDFIRKYMKVIAIPFFLIIILAFVFQSAGDYAGMSDKAATVATVNGHKITQSEWDAAHKNEVDRIRASRPNIDAKLLESDQARYATLERLVRERVLKETAIQEHLTTTDLRLAKQLQQDPTIASLRLPDGKLDMDRYRQLAASQGLTPEGFEARVRSDLSTGQLEAGVTSSAFAPAAATKVTLNAFFGRREVQVIRLNPADYSAKVNPSAADIDAFYEANQKLFQAQESAAIEYVVLDMEAVKKTVSVNEADLKSYYEQNATRLSGNEQRRASHILITAAKDAPAAERKKAKEKADALLIEARKSPESFAELARKNSQDTGSAPSGGDLDFFGRGAMVKPFEDAAFSMKKGDISEVVESDFGYHIIKVTDVKIPAQKTFEELRSSLESDLRTQQAQRKFAEVAEAFTNGVYEQADSLKPVADRLKLEVKTVANLSRKPGPAATGVLANPKLLAAIFSADSIEKKRNTEAVEVGSNQIAAARITQYTAARTLPLDEVREVVKARLVMSRSAEMAKADGLAKLEAWKGGAEANLPPAVVVARSQTSPIQGPMLDAILRADATTLPAWTGIDLGNQGYAVARINKVMEREPVATETATQERSQFAAVVARAEADAYVQLLKTRRNVQIKVPKPTKAAEATTDAQ